MRGSVVDIRFEDALPPIHALLDVGQAAEPAHSVIELQTQGDERHVRGIALTPTHPL